MHEAYDKGLISIAEKVAEEKGIRLVHGVYLGTQGPTYETPAEYKAYHMLGGDAIGMSTVPEVIVARHCGIKVFGISIITNIGLSDTPTEATHEEVQEAANQAQPRMAEIFRGIIQNADI
jgi:purine-nucleoside phosphorylase